MTGTKAKNQTKITAEKDKQELWIIREFDAPRELVFKTFTDPKLVAQWMGPRDLKMKIDYMSYKQGGSYRYTHTDAQGNEYGFHGAVHEATAPERIIQTFEFEGLPEKGHVCLETIRFEVLPGNRTRVAIQDIFQQLADRDGAIASGMESGIVESYERLDDVLASY
jgi:uncharacterized protein YndB with AHSA1/START domain